jgi:hypothetical protein
VLPANYRKLPFFGADEQLNEAATARYFEPAERRILRDWDSLAEGSEFELPVRVF